MPTDAGHRRTVDRRATIGAEHCQQQPMIATARSADHEVVISELGVASHPLQSMIKRR